MITRVAKFELGISKATDQSFSPLLSRQSKNYGFKGYVSHLTVLKSILNIIVAELAVDSIN